MAAGQGVREIPDSEEEPMTSSPVTPVDVSYGLVDKLSATGSVPFQAHQDAPPEAHGTLQAAAELVGNASSDRTDGLDVDRNNASFDVHTANCDHVELQSDNIALEETVAHDVGGNQIDPRMVKSSPELHCCHDFMLASHSTNKTKSTQVINQTPLDTTSSQHFETHITDTSSRISKETHTPKKQLPAIGSSNVLVSDPALEELKHQSFSKAISAANIAVQTDRERSSLVNDSTTPNFAKTKFVQILSHENDPAHVKASTTPTNESIEVMPRRSCSGTALPIYEAMSANRQHNPLDVNLSQMHTKDIIESQVMPPDNGTMTASGDTFHVALPAGNCNATTPTRSINRAAEVGGQGDYRTPEAVVTSDHTGDNVAEGQAIITRISNHVGNSSSFQSLASNVSQGQEVDLSMASVIKYGPDLEQSTDTDPTIANFHDSSTSEVTSNYAYSQQQLESNERGLHGTDKYDNALGTKVTNRGSSNRPQIRYSLVGQDGIHNNSSEHPLLHLDVKLATNRHAIEDSSIDASSVDPAMSSESSTQPLFKPSEQLAPELTHPTLPKTAQEITLAELKTQKAALLAALVALPAIQVLIEESASVGVELADEENAPTEADVMVAANKIVKDHIKLLHEYNELKDVGQGLMGLIADQRGVRIVEVQDEFGIDAND